ncbi:NmrA family transcriptional regulator [Micromonospora sp. HM134]|uniref:NAD(P)H-binding protein n=1 Tax=unclassified Micromonospora TaxID=2617518 RepID=UPI001198437D|nr:MULTISPECIES: NAD(P)H-binding protein [unclassified Micromonospora]QDY08764.1 NmrA family transcriptional regulator [Micromonospora sp. HM134]
MPDDLFAVTAATGALGRLAVAHLRERVRPDRIVAVARDPGRARDLAVAVRPGDYDSPGTLVEAFAGVTRLIFVSSPELDQARRTAQHRAVVAAARHAGVTDVVYTSFLPIAGLFDAHRATEEALAAAGLAHTVLRNPFYTEPFVDAAVGVDALVHATEGRGLNTATRADLAGAAVAALLRPDTRGRTYTLTGPVWTYPQLAAALGVVARPGVVAGAMGWLHGLARAGALEATTGDLRELLGRTPTDILGQLRTTGSC